MTGKQECHEAVTRKGQLQPCEKVAVGYRLDPVEGTPYPVCKKHHRSDYWVPDYDEVRWQHSLLGQDEIERQTVDLATPDLPTTEGQS